MPLAPPDRNVFSWLDDIRARPSMYLAESSHPLRELEKLSYGYHAALVNHGIVEPVPQLFSHFSTWLSSTRRWSGALGWARAIEAHALGKPEFELFFELIESFRALVPTPLRRARPLARRPPTDLPTRIEVVRYVPTRLHFLRLWHGRRAVNAHVLMDTQGSHETSLLYAKASAQRAHPGTRLEWTSPQN